MFDEGRLTDGKGTTIDCKDAIFVMTSNLGQREIADEALRMREQSLPEDRLDEEFQTRTIQPILKAALKRDEFLGRINEILYFLPFTDQQLRSLAERQLVKWADRAKERHQVCSARPPTRPGGCVGPNVQRVCPPLRGYSRWYHSLRGMHVVGEDIARVMTGISSESIQGSGFSRRMLTRVCGREPAGG